jgi:hypothetical protein
LILMSSKRLLGLRHSTFLKSILVIRLSCTPKKSPATSGKRGVTGVTLDVRQERASSYRQNDLDADCQVHTFSNVGDAN